MLANLKVVLTYVEGMWRFRWYALLVAWPVCLAGWFFVFCMPEIYQARAQVYIDTQSVLKPLLDGLAVRTEVTDRVGMMTRALVSRPTLTDVARAIDPQFELLSPLKQQAMLKGLEQRIYVGPGERPNMYEIRYQDQDRARSLLVVQLLLNNLVEDTVKLTRADSSIAQQFLDGQITVYEARLSEAELRLAAFKKLHVGMMPSQGEDYYSNLQEGMQALEQTQNALRLAINRRDELRRQLSGEEPVFGMVATPAQAVSELDPLIAKHQAELERLRLQFTDQHPDVVVLKEIISQLEVRRQEGARGSAAGGNVSRQAPGASLVYQATTIALSEAEIEVSTLHTKEAQLQASVDQLKQSVDTIPEVEAQLASLNRDYDITKTQYEALAMRLEAARLSEEAEQSNEEFKFRIIEPPVAPPAPVSVNRPLFLTVVLLAGLLAGIGLTFLLHQIRPVFLNTSMLGHALGLPVLGVVSLRRQLAARMRYRMELACLAIVTAMLIGAYGGTVFMHEIGARVLQNLMLEEKV